MFHETHKNGTHGNTQVTIYDGLSDAVRRAAELFARGVQQPSLDTIRDSYFQGRSFNGFGDVVAAVESPWEEGLQKVERLAAKLKEIVLPEPKSIRRRPAWREDEVGDFNLDRCMSGQSFWRTPTRREVGGPQTVSILCQIGATANVSAEAMMWRAAACVSLVTILEEAGYNCEVQAYSYALNTFTNRSNLLQSVWVKRAGDPLDLSSLVNATASWFRRTVGFTLANGVPGNTQRPGCGSQSIAPTEILRYMAETPEAAWVLQNVWTEEAAVEIARRYLNRLAEKNPDDAEAVGGRLVGHY